MPGVRRFVWGELASVPGVPGIYAWYYTPELTTRDLNDAISEIKKRQSDGNDVGAMFLARDLNWPTFRGARCFGADAR